MVEQRTCNASVEGSSPFFGTILNRTLKIKFVITYAYLSKFWLHNMVMYSRVSNRKGYPQRPSTSRGTVVGRSNLLLRVCRQVVRQQSATLSSVGANPTRPSIIMGTCVSGQNEQTVNLPTERSTFVRIEACPPF